jgi:hypothetical protein
MANQTEHLHFFDQIIYTLMDVREPVDFPAGKMGGGCHQVFMFGTKGEFIGESGGVDMRTKARMFGNVLHPFPVVIDNVMEVFKTLDVIFFRDDSFHWLLLHMKSKNFWIKGNG